VDGLAHGWPFWPDLNRDRLSQDRSELKPGANFFLNYIIIIIKMFTYFKKF
jgi:hypothetical protein